MSKKSKKPARTGEKVLVMYDERAAFQDTDDCMVLVTASSEAEARSYNKDFAGCWFEYDVVEGRELVNECPRYDLNPAAFGLDTF